MKLIFRTFFKTLRIVLGPFMLLWEYISTPKGVVRTPEAQETIDQRCKMIALYQFKTCPFCIKVRRTVKTLSLNIDLRDAQHHAQNRADLLQGGGQIKVPCLRVTDAQGKSHWLYESAVINQYLQQHFG